MAGLCGRRPDEIAGTLAYDNAIRAVLALHPAHTDATHGGPDYCPVCIAEDGGTQVYPCPTVRAVASALGCRQQTPRLPITNDAEAVAAHVLGDRRGELLRPRPGDRP